MGWPLAHERTPTPSHFSPPHRDTPRSARFTRYPHIAPAAHDSHRSTRHTGHQDALRDRAAEGSRRDGVSTAPADDSVGTQQVRREPRYYVTRQHRTRCSVTMSACRRGRGQQLLEAYSSAARSTSFRNALETSCAHRAPAHVSRVPTRVPMPSPAMRNDRRVGAAPSANMHRSDRLLTRADDTSADSQRDEASHRVVDEMSTLDTVHVDGPDIKGHRVNGQPLDVARYGECRGSRT